MKPFVTGFQDISRVSIAIPIKDEASRLPRLLNSLVLSAQGCDVPVTATILVNNSSDRSAEIARSYENTAINAQIREVTFSARRASAGHARAAAMRFASSKGGLIMTTDGDASVHPRWIASAVQEARNGADVVCGRISSRIPIPLRRGARARITVLESGYTALMHELRFYLEQMAGLLDPRARQPHYVESGATIAIRSDAFRRIGGCPLVRHSEDRALVAAARRHDLRISYSDRMRVRVSGRLMGRAEGGMAECLRERMASPDPLADQAILNPDLLLSLWTLGRRGMPVIWPDRSQVHGSRLRASDLEVALPQLTDLMEQIVRPQYAAWRAMEQGVAV